MFSLFPTKLFVILVFTLQHDSFSSQEACQVIVGTQSMFVKTRILTRVLTGVKTRVQQKF